MKTPAVLLLSLSLATGCTDILGGLPLEHSDAIELPRDQWLRDMWTALQSCSGRHRSFNAVEFYYVRRETLTSTGGVQTLGQFFPATNRIYVIEAKRNDADVVRHEMMHALIRDKMGHPPEYFSDKGRCGKL